METFELYLRFWSSPAQDSGSTTMQAKLEHRIQPEWTFPLHLHNSTAQPFPILEFKLHAAQFGL